MSEKNSQNGLSTREAAWYLGISSKALRLSRRSGKLSGRTAPTFRKMGRKYVYFKADLDKWLEELPHYDIPWEF